MISLTPLVEHLRPQPAGFAHLWFRLVGQAADYAQLHVQELPLPACWVVRAADQVQRAGERAANGSFAFDVVIAIENVRMSDTRSTDDDLLDYRRAVLARLEGWEIEPNVRPIQWRGGKALEYTDGDIYWADRYTLDALVTNYLPDPLPFGGLANTGDI
ncbi:hypothetical protein [Zoogloea sp.]|uniref:phage tail terminator protein n=1 Tax=Zoogloea sp. TaxID=49181 RepID=UPI002608F701|nr:hypothetical protein [Zoogloea sp.]